MSLLILAAVSGTGKSTVVRRLLARNPALRLSVSHTTRAPRPGEEDGVAYHFVDRAEFESTVEAGGFVEWAEYAGNLYGTAHRTVEAAERAGIDLLFEVEVVGAGNLKNAFPHARSVFLLPPSWAELEARLRGRGTESDAVIARRLATGVGELDAAAGFDHLVVNDELERAVVEVEEVYHAARSLTATRLDLLTALREEAKRLAPAGHLQR